jgi:chromosome segregation ATPase
MGELINKNKYLDFSGLKKYDILIKNFIESRDGALSDAISSLNNKIGNIEGFEYDTISELIDDIYSSIFEIVSTQDSLTEKDEDLARKIRIIEANLEFITGSNSDNSASFGEINEAILDIRNELNTIVGSVTKNSDDISAITQTLDSVDERLVALESVDHDKLIADAVASVVADAESDFDTLKEVADWIASDKENSTALQTTVSNHTDSINALTGDLDALEIKVNEDIENLSKHMSDASIALSEVDGRLDSLEAFEETHSSIEISVIEGLFT